MTMHIPEPEPVFDPLTGRRLAAAPWCVFCGSSAHWTYEHQSAPWLREGYSVHRPYKGVTGTKGVDRP